jgi:hypothetical protein
MVAVIAHRGVVAAARMPRRTRMAVLVTGPGVRMAVLVTGACMRMAVLVTGPGMRMAMLVTGPGMRMAIGHHFSRGRVRRMAKEDLDRFGQRLQRQHRKGEREDEPGEPGRGHRASLSDRRSPVQARIPGVDSWQFGPHGPRRVQRSGRSRART